MAEPSRPIIIAHRGASGYLPEHTLPAKALAHGLGADFLEQDLVLTRDDVPIVLHDIYLDTVTDVADRFPDRHRADGRFYALDFTLVEVKQLRVTERFNLKTGQPVFPGRFPSHQGEFHLSTLEEELQFIQGLNHSLGRIAGIYPELKQPHWHRQQGHDLSRIVLPILRHYGYGTESDACWLQCFEWVEIKRVRQELGWTGRIVLLLEAKGKGADGTDYKFLSSPAGLAEIARGAEGIGPAIESIVTWNAAGQRQVSHLVRDAHAAGLVVHPYTIRIDALPANCSSAAELHEALFRGAHIDGTFTDFTDVTIAWLRQAGPEFTH